MFRRRYWPLWLLGILLIVVLVGNGMSKKRLGRLSLDLADHHECGTKPNCVCSVCQKPPQAIEPFRGLQQIDLGKLQDVLQSMPRVKVVTQDEDYLHAEFRSRILRFVDDVEFLFDRANGVIHVRSASRIGRSDLGVNRKRVEGIRAILD